MFAASGQCSCVCYQVPSSFLQQEAQGIWGGQEVGERPKPAALGGHSQAVRSRPAGLVLRLAVRPRLLQGLRESQLWLQQKESRLC